MRISTSLFHYRGVSSMQDLYSRLSHTQLQLSSGRRMLTPADDPVAAQQSLELGRSLSRTDQFNTNADRATLRLQTEEGVLTSVGDDLQRIRELALQASNDSNSQESRSYIATEMRELLSGLLDLANATDGNGEFMFSGSKTTTKPFSRITEDTFAYDGDQGQRFAQIGENRQVAVSDPGDEVFNFIRAGNGYFTTAARYEDPNGLPPVAANTGTAVMGPGTLVDNSYIANPAAYTITFTDMAYADDGTGAVWMPASTVPPGAVTLDTRIDYSVTDTVTSAVITGGTYTLDMDIEFNGIKVPFKGTPGDGDEFFIEPSPHQSLFNTVYNIIDAIEHAGSNDVSRTEFHNKLDNELASLDEGLTKILDIRALIGGRLNGISAQKDMGEASALQFETMISDLTDLDYAEAVSRFQQQMTGLQASQQAYSKVSNLSLFNYI